MKKLSLKSFETKAINVGVSTKISGGYEGTSTSTCRGTTHVDFGILQADTSHDGEYYSSC